MIAASKKSRLCLVIDGLDSNGMLDNVNYFSTRLVENDAGDRGEHHWNVHRRMAKILPRYTYSDSAEDI
jgi:hypothetical protein